MRGPPVLFPALPALNMLDQFPSAPGVGGFLLDDVIGRDRGLSGRRVRQHYRGHNTEACHEFSARTPREQWPVRICNGNVHCGPIARRIGESTSVRRQHRIKEARHQPDAPTVFAFAPDCGTCRVQVEYFRSRVHRVQSI